MFENLLKRIVFIFLILQFHVLFSQGTLKSNLIDFSKPKYEILLNYMEFTILNSAMLDGISQYKGNIELNVNVKFENEQMTWDITSTNKIAFDVLNLYVAQKSIGFLKTINIDNATPADKITISAMSSLSTKIDAAIKNPIYENRKISGLLKIKGGKYFVENLDTITEIIGLTDRKIDSLLEKRVSVLGYIKEVGKIEMQSIHSKKDNTLELFIMSQCPYGTQALKYIFSKTDSLIPKKQIKLEVHYIFSKKNNNFTSLHGEPEIIEDMVQMVLRDNYPSLFQSYLRQRVIFLSESWQIVAGKANINKKIIEQIDNKIANERNAIISKEYDYMINNYQMIDASPTYIWESDVVNSLDKLPMFKGGQSVGEGKCKD